MQTPSEQTKQRTASWAEFTTAAPAIAADGLRLLYAGAETAGAFLATVAPRGQPRLHPVMPVLAAGELWLFIVSMSPKYGDLTSSGRFALHSMPTPAGGEEFALQGLAQQIDEGATRARVVAATGGRQGLHEFERLFRCGIATALHTYWDGWGTAAAWPRYAKWHA